MVAAEQVQKSLSAKCDYLKKKMDAFKQIEFFLCI